MKEWFKDFNFRENSLAKIDIANSIINDYSAMGYELTLRQLYYQFVARDYIANNQKEYNKLGVLINNARLAGLVDWDAISDRTRHLRRLSHWDNPAQIVSACAQQYRRDKWEDQDYYIEVWVEKDALIDIVQQSCNAWDVPCFSCRGYVSQSAMYEASKRLGAKQSDGREVVIIHLGDHDPSGIDMTRDIFDRLDMFEGIDDVNRIALNMEQVEELEPPPNPAKITDSRARDYIARFGTESWELDALEPKYLDNLIQDTILNYLDEDKYRELEDQEETEKGVIRDAAMEMMQ